MYVWLLLTRVTNQKQLDKQVVVGLRHGKWSLQGMMLCANLAHRSALLLHLHVTGSTRARWVLHDG